MTLIDIIGVNHTYESSHGEVHALKDVFMKVDTGQFVSILGPSGCGKSTLLKLIAGFITPSGGEITFHGKVIESPITEVGIVFQESLLFDWKNVLENVLVQIRIRKRPVSEYELKAKQLLENVGLGEFIYKRPFELSGGMKQRVAICRALVHDPQLLLMDEPFGALDALTREQMRYDLEKIWMDKRKTVVFVTHSITEAVSLSDRVFVMTKRPGTIESIVDIPLERPRSDKKKRTELEKYADQIYDIMYEQGLLKL